MTTEASVDSTQGESIEQPGENPVNPYSYSTRNLRMVQDFAHTSSNTVQQVMQSFTTELANLRDISVSMTNVDNTDLHSSQQHRYSSHYTASQSQRFDDIVTDQCEESPVQHEVENILWGDSIYKTKTPGDCRIYFQNIHGLRTTSSVEGKWLDCLNVMHYYDVDIFGFVETCTNWSNRRLVQRHNRIARQRFHHCHIDYSFNNHHSSSDYLPGGALQGTVGHWTGRLQGQLSDPYKMGRWTGSKYVLNEHQALYIITLYRVYKDATLGVCSSYTQQMLALRKRFGPDTECSPRKQVFSDLIEYIQSLQLNSHDHLLLMLDANEELGEDLIGIQTVMQKLQLVDLFTLHHGHDCDIATYNRSEARRIDYIVGSNSLLPHVQRCGYLPFAKGIDSDHRGLFIDFAKSLTSGDLHLNIPYTRKVGVTTCKRELYAYKQQVLQQFLQSNIISRAQNLYNSADPSLDDDRQFTTALNKLDEEVTAIVLKAEKDCCTIKPSFPWSEEIKFASLLIKYWQLQYHNRHSTRKRDISQALQRIYDQLPSEAQVSIDLASSSPIHRQLRLAKQAKKDLYRQYRQKRAERLEQRHVADAQFSGTSVDKIRATHLQRQTDDQLFRYLRTVYPKHRGKGITSIEVPDKDNAGQPTTDPLKAVSWRLENNPANITQALLRRNIAHFGQSAQSPFASDPLRHVFGFHGTNQNVTEVLQGSSTMESIINDPSLHPGALAILQKLADTQGAAPMSDTVTFEEFWKAFRAWDERTSTSPSNRHLGHYRSLLLSDGNDQNYDDDNPNPSTLIQRVYYHIAMAAVNSGNTLHRWARSSTMMLEKTPGQPRIHRLRVIHIFEADYNLMLKILWARKLVYHSHRSKILHSSQAGSRPDHRCIDVVLRKEMNYQYSRFTRTPLATIDNDAKACYDRIICNLAMMISQYHGMSHRACRFHSKTLERMRFTIRTAGGDSKESYAHSTETPIHGSGQGSCASPSLWLHISSILLRIHASLAQGMTRFDVLSHIETHISAEGFVDDISLFVNNPVFHNQALELIIEAISKDINLWQDLLAGSGGKLELDKCFYYIIAWKFNKFGDAIPQTKEDLQPYLARGVNIRDPDTDRFIPLSCKDIHEDHKTLGVLKTMSGNEQAQLQSLIKKSDTLATSTALGQLTRFQARRAYSSIYMPAMTYSLVATSLSEADLNKVQSKALRAFLPAMGYEPTFPRAIVHGPRAFGGINLGHLYTEMCIAKIGALMSHLQATTGLGQIMLTNINWLQLHSGLSQPIFQDTSPLSYLPTNWFLHLREFLHSINGTLTIRDQWTVGTERIGDVALMDKIHGSQYLTTAQKRIFNNWRLFFQVSTLSDITSPNGEFIQDHYWRIRDQRRADHIVWRTTTHNWPVQQAPDASTFKIWKKGLRDVFRISDSGQLLCPLGDWTVTPTQSFNRWKYYYNIRNHKLYVRHDNTSYFVHLSLHGYVHRTRLRYDIVPEEIVDIIPDTCFPVQVETTEAAYIVLPKSFSGPLLANDTNPTSNDFDLYLGTLPQWRQDLLLHWQTASLDQLRELWSNLSELMIATDGSFVEETSQSSFGVVIGDYSQEFMTVLGNAPGNPSLQSSFRAELYGILAACVFIIEVTKFAQLYVRDGMRLRFHVDNKGAIERLQRHRVSALHLGEYLATDMDVELQILDELEQLRILGYTVDPILHVKSHQDATSDFNTLSRPAQLNVLADRLATSMHSQRYVHIDYSSFPSTKVQLVINNAVITAKYKENIRSAYHSQDLREYYISKFEWQPSTIDQIWWEPFNRAICKLSHAERQKIQKFNVRRLHTNNREQLFHRHLSANCPHCNIIEDNDHLLRCSQCTQARRQRRTEWQSDLLDYLSTEHTPPLVKTVIFTAVVGWMSNRQIPPVQEILPDGPVPIYSAYESQMDIGWDNFLRGKLSTLWEPIVSDHLRTHGIGKKCMTAKKWASELLQIVWTGVLDIWSIRNQEIHGSDASSIQHKEKEKLLHEAAYWQRMGYQDNGNDYQWFQKSRMELEKYSVYSLKAWVQNARTIVRLRHQEQKNQL